MALKGIKVLEFAGLAPGPFCGMVLADFGASVIRIDKIQGAADFDVLGNGKKSLSVNVKNKAGVNLLRKLSKESDVLLEPFRAGVMESLGLGPDILLKENPKLIYARLTGFGQQGPYSKRAGHDINYIAVSGLLSLLGRSNERPMFPINLAADFAGGGLMCAMGIILALFERSVSNKGQVIDCNMVEGSAYLASWIIRSRKLPIWHGKRGENILDGGAHFYEVYETKDGKYMSVGAIEPQFYKELLQGLEIDENDLGPFDFVEGKEMLTKKFLEKTQDEWSEIFEGRDACVFPVVDFNEAGYNKHNKANNSFLKVGDDFVPKPAPRLSRTPGFSKAGEEDLVRGKDTVEVLKELGCSSEEIEELHKEGVIKITSKSKI